MNVFDFFKTDRKHEGDTETLTFTIDRVEAIKSYEAEMRSAHSRYTFADRIFDAISHDLANTLLPIIKDKMLSGDGMEKLMNQVRLTLVAKSLNNK